MGWLMPKMTGDAVPGQFGTDYMLRAVIAYVMLVVNRPIDAIYPQYDTSTQPLSGSENHVIHFEPGQTPPVNEQAHGFWSITMYDDKFFVVDNPLDRYAIVSDGNLVKNADGSLDIFVQSADPGGDKTNNWLPSPKDGNFNLTFRVYAPTDRVLSGQWRPPAVALRS